METSLRSAVKSERSESFTLSILASNRLMSFRSQRKTTITVPTVMKNCAFCSTGMFLIYHCDKLIVAFARAFEKCLFSVPLIPKQSRHDHHRRRAQRPDQNPAHEGQLDQTGDAKQRH